MLLWLLAWPHSLMIASSAGSTRKRQSNWYYPCQWSRITWRWIWNMSGQSVSSTRSSTEDPLCREVNRRRVVEVRFQLERGVSKSAAALPFSLPLCQKSGAFNIWTIAGVHHCGGVLPLPPSLASQVHNILCIPLFRFVLWEVWRSYFSSLSHQSRASSIW